MFYAAVAKGSAAATLLSKSDKDPAVDDCEMIYDLDEAPAVQLADRWSDTTVDSPSLPSTCSYWASVSGRPTTSAINNLEKSIRLNHTFHQPYF
jgi:hypothetical protein